MFEIKRLDLTDKEKEEFLQLMRTSLSNHSVDWLEWKYINNPLIKNKPTVFGAIHKSTKKLVGIRPFLACNVAYGKKLLKLPSRVIQLCTLSSEGKACLQK